MSYQSGLKDAINSHIRKNQHVFNFLKCLSDIELEMKVIENNIQIGYNSVSSWNYIATVSYNCAVQTDMKNSVDFESLHSLLCYKHLRYGSKNLTKRGEYGILVRLDDKLSRAEKLIQDDEQDEVESLTDTFLDICGYSIQAIGMEEGWFHEDMEDEFVVCG